MKAAVYEKYGPPEVVQVREVPKPTPKKDEVLVKVHASTIRAGDVRMRSLDIPGGAFEQIMSRLYLGITGPKRKVLGMELSGEIEATGKDVTRFKMGDPVYATTELEFGGHAEYKCLREDRIVAIKPANMTYEEAAAVPTGALGALPMVRDKVKVQNGQKVLVFGSSGSVGSYSVQFAKNYGADVTAVCSTRHLEWVQAMGADQVIDYTKEDFTKLGVQYDGIIDGAGILSKSDCKDVLVPDGRFESIHDMSYKESSENLDAIRDLIEVGKITAVIDQVFPLEEIVEAYRYVEAGSKKGNVVIRVSASDQR